jgi:hypothetical protein
MDPVFRSVLGFGFIVLMQPRAAFVPHFALGWLA